MTGKFLLCLSHTLRWEGGYINDAVDPGGETNMGISKRSHPNEDIRNMTYARATEIYWSSYWLPSRAGDIQSYRVAGKYFDLCVNMGPRPAAKLLQRAANLIGSPPLVVDGKVGPKTLSRVNHVPDDELLTALIGVAKDRYRNIVDRRPAMQKYWNGWMNRLEDTL